MPPRKTSVPRSNTAELATRIGQLVVRFQDGTAQMDRVASRVLGLEQQDLPALALLFFGGPQTQATLSARLGDEPAMVRATVGRLEYTGYARNNQAFGRLELTPHAKEWIATLWQPLQKAGNKLCGKYDRAQLATLASFLEAACQVQERQAARARRLLQQPADDSRRAPAQRVRARGGTARGGLSPAALRRVQLFVQSNLSDSIKLADLAERAELSEFHFARAFKRSTGTTPRAYVEACRIAAAERLLGETALPLARVALMVGLGSQSRLTTAFRRATGLTPARYRRMET